MKGLIRIMNDGLNIATSDFSHTNADGIFNFKTFMLNRLIKDFINQRLGQLFGRTHVRFGQKHNKLSSAQTSRNSIKV